MVLEEVIPTSRNNNIGSRRPSADTSNNMISSLFKSEATPEKAKPKATPSTPVTAASSATAQMDSLSISSSDDVGVPKAQGDASVEQNKPPRFQDGDGSGYYIGELSADGKERHGRGTMIYDSGCEFTGTFVSDKFHGKGHYVWTDGDNQDGTWKEGLREGPSIFQSANTGEVQYSIYENGQIVGEGVFWSADRKTALKLINGKKNGPMSLEEAEKICKEKFGWPVPPAVDMTLSPLVELRLKTNAQPGMLRRLFPQNGQLGEGGKRMFKDNGEFYEARCCVHCQD